VVWKPQSLAPAAGQNFVNPSLAYKLSYTIPVSATAFRLVHIFYYGNYSISNPVLLGPLACTINSLFNRL